MPSVALSERDLLSVDESGAGTGFFLASPAEQALDFRFLVLRQFLLRYRAFPQHLVIVGIFLSSSCPIVEVVI